MPIIRPIIRSIIRGVTEGLGAGAILKFHALIASAGIMQGVKVGTGSLSLVAHRR